MDLNKIISKVGSSIVTVTVFLFALFMIINFPMGSRMNRKNHELYLKQKALLQRFLSTRAISQAQHDKSLHDLQEKMGEME